MQPILGWTFFRVTHMPFEFLALCLLPMQQIYNVKFCLIGLIPEINFMVYQH